MYDAILSELMSAKHGVLCKPTMVVVSKHNYLYNVSRDSVANLFMKVQYKTSHMQLLCSSSHVALAV